MADSNTTVLDLLIMEVDSHNNDWGDQTSANLAIMARAIGATVSHAVTTGTSTLTRDNVKDAVHRVTGVLVGNVIIEVPATEPKTYFWKNETTGAFSVTIKVTGQTGVVLPQGETRLLRCNGTDVLDVGLFNDRYATVVGGTVDAITVTTVPGYAAYATSMRFRFVSGGLCTITNPTVNVDGIGAKTVKKWGGAALRAGEIGEVGHVCDCTYDGTNVILLNPAGRYETLTIACGPEDTAMSAGTAKIKWRQKACKVQAVRASLSTAQASGTIFTVDINEAGTTILSTKLTIDNTESTSTTAATPAVISDADIADDAEMSIDVDTIGNGSAIGLKTYLDVRYAS